jgi:HSP20 family protein
MEQHVTAAKTPLEQINVTRLAATNEVFDQVDGFYELVARRAFEMFQQRGGCDGNDLDDWFCAEAELVHVTHLDVTESDSAFAVFAEVPGFTALELQVSVAPRRLAIRGKREARRHPVTQKVIYRDRCSEHIFRVLSFPVDVDTQKVTAVLRDGVLELAMPKAPTSTRILVDARKDWIVRTADHRAWRQSLSRLLEVGANSRA